MIGIVLAGGASSRFDGRPKGLLPLNGLPMALHVAAKLAAVCSSVFIEAPRNAGYETLALPIVTAPPEHAGKGPLAGIAAGLALTETLAAFAPCDMPFLTPDIFLALKHQAHLSGGTHARTPVGDEPLVAVLNAKIRSKLLQALAQNDIPRTYSVLKAAGVNSLLFESEAPFANVNTPTDLARLSFPCRDG